MTEKRTVFISGTPYTVTISSEQEVLSAAYAAGGAIIGLWDKNRSGQSLAPADYVVECAEDADEEFLERVVRRRLHMPWIIAETERLVIREFTAEDAAHMISEDAGPGDAIFHSREKLTAYIDSQYRFFEYGIWAVVEKESMAVIGKAGLFQPTAEFLNGEIQQTEFRQAEIQQTESQQAEASPPQKKEDTPLELGYHIFTPWRRSGYAKEACREILNYGTGRLTGCICAVIAEGNTASIRLAESLGFRLTAQRYSESAGLLYLYEASCS